MKCIMIFKSWISKNLKKITNHLKLRFTYSVERCFLLNMIS
ncbi:hypothetical protein P689_122255 [Candidatus Riesia pediculischaeffi PTSU]|uniref:Uncharacterized protein n=1 Tax=Candidatus Riesia pediculischaeffi PTSU TaxID=1401651 RepID=A0A0C1V7G1_9ENTR|nr:hypothetical protein P689_122255 [Candidatus Riesia pediculischaeffi PTSU]